jgi:glycoprotein 6-alpha-L-fucosyltransferase
MPLNFLTWKPNGLSSYWFDKTDTQLTEHHIDPPLLVKAALLRYVVQLQQEEFATLFRQQAMYMKLQRPYGAMHVRRGDKVGHEADKHELDEYMEALQVLHDGTYPKHIFVATDDPHLIDEARKKYPQVTFHTLKGASEMAAKGFTNIKGRATTLTLCDIAWLANADYMVGTFSSQISRLAFELHISRQPDITYIFRELAAPDPSQPVVAESRFGTPFRLPHKGHGKLQARVASLDSGYYYGTT